LLVSAVSPVRKCPDCATDIAIGARFCGGCGHKILAEPVQLGFPIGEPDAALEMAGERREVAVLFGDISGFTAMCEHMDPEEVHAVMNECFEGLAQAIRDEGGHIDKYIGDNVMALFGAPIAHEDDAARACRAALGMQAFLAKYGARRKARRQVELRMRIGIHYGLVLAGGVGSTVKMEYSVLGDTVNLASRLETSAPPGGILVSRDVVRNSRGRFSFGPAEHVTVKGKSHPVEAHELLKEIAAVDIRGRDGLSVAMVGREQELATLIEAWSAAERNGQWIQITGEIGIGKTRLVEEAAHRARLPVLTVAATASDTRRSFGLAQRLVRTLVGGLAVNGSVETRDDFDATLAPLGDSILESFGDVLWYLAAPSRLTVAPPERDPQTMRRMLERGTMRLVEAFAQSKRGTAIFLDSYELADDASRRLFDGVAESPQGWPLAVLVASRERGGEGQVATEIALPRIARDDSERLLAGLVRNAALPRALGSDLIDRAAGVPLFLEEMVRSLIDQNALIVAAEPVWTWDAERRVSSVTLPSSIRGAMVARLDTLERPGKTLMCQCAVQGVEFSLLVAERVRRSATHSDPPLMPLIRDLEARTLVVPHSLGNPSIRTFQQPLLQEAAYETLLVRNRQRLHLAVADALCELAGGPQGVAPESLAFHYQHGERWTEAAEACLRAADRASELYLNEEALRWYQLVLDLAAQIETPDEPMPDGPAQTLSIKAGRGMAVVHLRVGNYAAAEAAAVQMQEVATRTEDRAEARRLRALAWSHIGRTPDAERLLLEAKAMLRRVPSATEVAADIHLDLAALYHWNGRLEDAKEQVTQCRAIADPSDARLSMRIDMLAGGIAHTEGTFGRAAVLYRSAYEEAQRVGSLSDRARTVNALGNAARDVGDYDAAERYFLTALDIWTRTGDVECIAGAQNNLGNLAMSRGDLARAREHHHKSLAASDNIGNVPGIALANTNLAILQIEDGDGAGAVAAAERALAALGSEASVLRYLTLGVLGEARLLCNELTAARTVFDEVLGAPQETRHPLAMATAWRGLGRVLLRQEEPKAALAMLDRALAAFESLERAQEIGRTLLSRGEARWRANDPAAASEDVRRARAIFETMAASTDIARADRALAEFAAPAAPPSSPPTEPSS
jgi:class 3 adenylate cyclase/tetratricopeptide (TPR) repeat protein